MKHFSLALLAILSLAVVISCAPVGDTDMTLPNGTVITQTDIDYLNSLQPKADAIINDVLGSSRAIGFTSGKNVSMTADENMALKDRLIQLLKDEVGADYRKYVVEGSLGDATEITSEPVASRGFGVDDGSNSAYQYAMLVDCRYCMLPWGTWDWATTSHIATLISTGDDSPDNVQTIYAKIVDEANPSGVEASSGPASSVTATGKPKFGFFVKIKNISSTHRVWDENITNGYINRTYSWTM